MLGLQMEPSPALHLPPSELLKALVEDVNSTLDRFIEEQTPNAFIPLQMKRQRRYYHTSEPVLAVPHAVPPGLVSLTLDKSTEPNKRPVTIPLALVPFFETALAGAGEVVSWFDWWLATMSKLWESLPKEARVDFQRLVVSVSKALEFLVSQTVSALSNFTLLRRDSLPADVRSTVPPRNCPDYVTPHYRTRRHYSFRAAWTQPSVRCVRRQTTRSFTRHSIRPESPRDSLRARADLRQPRLTPWTDQGLHL